jgi:hypothetical protein
MAMLSRCSSALCSGFLMEFSVVDLLNPFRHLLIHGNMGSAWDHPMLFITAVLP